MTEIIIHRQDKSEKGKVPAEMSVVKYAGNAVPVMSTSSYSSSSQSQYLAQESLKKVMDGYIKYYAGGKNHTSKAKRYDLSYFLTFLAESIYGSPNRINDVLVADWTLQTTNDFVEHRIKIGESPKSIARRLATIKHFGRTLAERVSGYINPAREACSPKLEPVKPQRLSPQELESLSETLKILNQRSEGDFKTVRNNFMLEILLATGLRADEVRALTMGQLSEDFKFFNKVKTKGRKFRNVYLDSQIRIPLQEYLEKRESFLMENLQYYKSATIGEKNKIPFFISTKNAIITDPSSLGMNPKTIWRIIANFGKETNRLAETENKISKIHPHKLRHTFAHEVLDTSKDIRLLAQILGHSSVSTTMIYTERTGEDIIKAIENKVKGKQAAS